MCGVWSVGLRVRPLWDTFFFGMIYLAPALNTLQLFLVDLPPCMYYESLGTDSVRLLSGIDSHITESVS